MLMNGSQNNYVVACEIVLEYLIEMKNDKLILWWIIMCWNVFYEINLSGVFFLVEFCVWQTMDGSSGSDFLHVWSIHRSCAVGQHGRQVCRQPIIAGSEMVTICSSGCFKRIQKNQNFFQCYICSLLMANRVRCIGLLTCAWNVFAGD